MKTQEEIEQIYHRLYDKFMDKYDDHPHYYSFMEGYTQCQNDMLHDQTVTRFEVIDENGRVYVAKDCKVELSYQDDGRTLKIFIK
jgi:hypothetical protein